MSPSTGPLPTRSPPAFHAAHEREYGFSTPERPVELVALRCRARGATRTLPALDPDTTEDAEEPERITLAGGVRALHASRAGLAAGSELDGPAVITQPDATTFIPEGWQATVDASGNLLVTPR